MNTRTLIQVVASYARCPAEARTVRLTERLREEPRCAVTRYLLACQCFDRGRSAQAVRHMMVAHRVEPDFQSAALLVFAGLNWVSRRGAVLLPVLLDTWEEFRRPEFDCYRKERLLLDAFAEPEDGLERVSALARRLWRLPILTLRTQIREALLSPEAAPYPLLTQPAM
ncbi:MAG: hypothetical protein KKB50_05175 [Planctomycetes bacterium]|nr:hypothetical protein [Planctomycetota bacterium]